MRDDRAQILAVGLGDVVLVVEMQFVVRVCTYPFLNPQTGPIVVEGAEPGDTLVVRIHSLSIYAFVA